MTSEANRPLQFNVRVSTGVQTHTGQKKANNEDFAVFYEPKSEQDRTLSGCLYIVADGVGGGREGERASRKAAEKVSYEYYRRPQEPPGERLRSILTEAGNEIYEYAENAGKGKMATTMVAAVVRGYSLTLANVGDSRAYLVHDGTARRLTRDHNLYSELERGGDLPDSEAQRAKARRTLTRSLGGEQDVTVDIYEDQIFPGDYLVLCSDGLHGYLDEDGVELGSFIHPDLTTAQIAQEMVEYANKRGGKDNITALVVSVQSAQQPQNAAGRKRNTADLMATEVRFPKKSLAATYQFKPIHLLYGLPVLLTVLIIFVGVDLVSRYFGPMTATIQPTIALVPGSDKPITPNPEKIEALTQTAIAQIANPEKRTVTVTPSPTVTPTFTVKPTELPKSCVYRVQKGETITGILQKIQTSNGEIHYDPNHVYLTYTTCDSETNICEVMRKIEPNNHNDLKQGEYLVIEEVKESKTCIEGIGGNWVTFSP